MKTGAILYIVGDEPDGFNATSEDAANRLNIKADMVEIVSSRSGHFDISDAWWFLTVRGMQHIVCKVAAFSQMGDLQLTGRELRLCG